MARGLVTTAPGLEPVLREELVDAGADPISPGPPGRGILAFETADARATAELAGRLRTAHRIGHHLVDGRVELEDPWPAFQTLVEEADLAPWLDLDSAFAVRCTRWGEHAFDSMDVEREVGAMVFERLERAHGARPTVELDDPDVVLRVRVGPEGRAVLWVDLVGYRSLHRRGYRTYQHHAAMKGSLACGLLDLMGYDGGDIVDPMAGGGTLGIEGLWQAHGIPPIALRRDDLTLWGTPRFREADRDALLPVPRLPDTTGEPPRARAVLGDIHPPHVQGLGTNAEAAGVAGAIDPYVGDISTLADHVERTRWLVANPPYGMRSSSPREVERVYRVLFEQARHVLADDGRLGLMTPLDELVIGQAEAHGFQVAARRPVMHGRLAIELFVLAP